jgi:DNA-binding MarR family transcriptional regulator
LPKAIISEISRALIEIAWQLGPKGIDGKCCDDLTLAEFMALDRVLMNPSCSVNEIGISLGFTKSGATRVVDRLEK